MTEHDDLDRKLARWFEADALGPAPAGRFQQAIEATRTRRPRTGLLAGLGSHWAETGLAADAPRVSWRSIAVIVLVALALALAASAVFVGGRRPVLPPLPVLPAPIGPDGNGLIAYSSDGDIFVGDPITGATTAIVSGPEIDSGPIFSPAGTRIAFIRGNPWTEEASLVVVRVDGTDERVVMPAGYSQRGTTFTWTPDGGSLLVNHDSAPFTTPYFDGELSLIDASGVAEPRLLTPPLPIVPGASYFGYTDHVAPMFRPPNGDLILSHATDAAVPDHDADLGIYVWDADLESHTTLEPEGLTRPTAGWSWSPDGSMIAFVSGNGFYIMNADGSDVRRLEGVEGRPSSPTSATTWSPDGSTLAFQRCSTSPAGDGTVIVILDVASGDERVLEATAVQTKTEGAAHSRPPETAGKPLCGYYQGPTGRAWDYEGWSWSPDGRSIVMLERYGTRPMVVDVETGQATDLPWEADSAPSWQRILPTGPG